MAKLSWDISKALPEILNASMDRLEMAAGIIRDNAKVILRSKIDPKNPPHDVTRAPYGGKYWTERKPGSMIKTIRVTRRDDKRNVWIIAGNSKTWWAIQMEYGHGQWKGGPRSFFRPAIKVSIPAIKTMLLNG